jgi:hypothetical protein
VRDAWLNEWLHRHPGWVLANDGEPGSRWLAEDGWMDNEPAAPRPPFTKRPSAVAWALVRQCAKR